MCWFGNNSPDLSAIRISSETPHKMTAQITPKVKFIVFYKEKLCRRFIIMMNFSETLTVIHHLNKLKSTGIQKFKNMFQHAAASTQLLHLIMFTMQFPNFL